MGRNRAPGLWRQAVCCGLKLSSIWSVLPWKCSQPQPGEGRADWYKNGTGEFFQQVEKICV